MPKPRSGKDHLAFHAGANVLGVCYYLDAVKLCARELKAYRLVKGTASALTVCHCVQRSMLQSGQSSFDSMYEETNNMLKNMHFQRLMRHCPNSPEPAEKGTRSMS